MVPVFIKLLLVTFFISFDYKKILNLINLLIVLIQ
jgi:hypothetical protein